MSKEQIKQLIEGLTDQDGLTETGVKGVRLFRATQAIPCVPAVVVAIVSGAKEAVLDGERHVYDSNHYLCCPMSMPVQAGTPTASPDNPLYGVYVSLDQRMMTELTLEMENLGDHIPTGKNSLPAQGIKLARWGDAFTDALKQRGDEGCRRYGCERGGN
ncbi:hypothetical protein GQR58_029743 [Nymphon striatum]|nr:hypothetical protein GQR58_029743 [Nymphon striatum]